MTELNIETLSIILACGSIIIGVARFVDKNKREVKIREGDHYLQLL